MLLMKPVGVARNMPALRNSLFSASGFACLLLLSTNEVNHRNEEPMSLYIGEDIPPAKLQNARQSHGIDIHDSILLLVDLTFFGSAKNSLLFTSSGISYKNDENSYFIGWYELSHVDVIERQIVAYGYGGDHVTWTPGELGLDVNSQDVESALRFIAELMADLIQAWAEEEDDFDDIAHQLDQAEVDEDWERLISIAKSFDKETEGPKSPRKKVKYLCQTSKALLFTGNVELADQLYATAFDVMREGGLPYEDPELSPLLHELSAHFDAHDENWFAALQSVDRASGRIKPEMVKILENKFGQTFLEKDDFCKDILYVGEAFAWGYDVEKLLVLPKKNWPTGVNCSIPGHPRKDSLYVVHPHKPNVYLPYGDHDLLLFREKFSELCRLLQHLGAATVDLISGDQGTLAEVFEESGRVDITGNTLIKSGALSGEAEESVRANSYGARQMGISQKFAPPKVVDVPDDLVWLESEPEWQSLIKQRMRGGLLSHNIAFSTHDIEVVDELRRLGVAAELENLAIGASVSVAHTLQTKREREWKSQYQVAVTFYPLPEPSQADVSKSISESPVFDSNAENDYREMLVDALEDGVIEPAERRMLERMRERWGISIERAAEIEDSLSYTDAEQDYLEEVRFVLSDNGEISAAERRLLQRVAQKLGISPERADALERAVV